jgi:poly-gamma-glutamate synthesis protein (capsule biosynthesis protein)
LAYLAEADVRLINLECVIAAIGEPWRPEEKVFHFRASPRGIDALLAARIDAVSLANNHVLDFGADALSECLLRLDAASIAHAGAGRNIADARWPAFIHGHDQTIGLLSLTDNEPEWAASGSKPGVFYIDYNEQGLLERHRSEVESAIREARQHCEILIVAAHVGPNWGPPSAGMCTLARQLITLGADCYWGHSNHTPQAVEVFQGKPILHSTGDFIDDYAIHPDERNDLTFLFLLDWPKGNAGWELKLVPMRIAHFQSRRAFGEDAEFLCNRMQRQSAVFGTQLRREDDALVVRS